MLVIDGTNLILGRAGSFIAKQILNGLEVHVINAEKFIMTGDPAVVTNRYLLRRRAKHKGTPEFSPVWSKNPNMLVRRILRGMLPWKTTRGKDAYRRLKVYIGNPKNLTGAQTVETAKFTKPIKHITIHQLCTGIGYAK